MLSHSFSFYFFPFLNQKTRGEALKAALDWQPTINKPDASTTPKSSEKKQGTPFKRVEDSEWMCKVGILSEVDNSYEARFGEGGYGAQSNAKLRTVQGKKFQHEKTKLKRKTYRGGIIDTSSGNSFKFKHSDDEDE